MNLCCPHGYAFIPNPDYDFDYPDYDTPFMICTPVPGVQYHPTFWRDGAVAMFQKNKDYHLISPTMNPGAFNPHLFECPHHEGDIGAIFVPDDIAEFRLLTTGRLEGSGLPVQPSARMRTRRPMRKNTWSWISKSIKRVVRQITFEPEPVTETKTWTREEFCMIQADPPEYDTEETNQMKLTFMTCLPEETKFGDQFNKIFQPLSKIVPTICLGLTLIVYLVQPSLRDCLIGKIIIALITNNIVSFIIATNNYLLETDPEIDRRETPACVFSGYLGQYTFLAFFFWMNVMALDIWIKFKNMSPHVDKELEKKKFVYYTLYAQGTSLLICSVTAIVDSFSAGKYANDLLHYPEMGVYSCFLGSVRTGGRVSYFERPEFIYFSSFILLILIINALLLALTTHKLVESWKNQAELRKINQR